MKMMWYRQIDGQKRRRPQYKPNISKWEYFSDAVKRGFTL